MKKELLLPYLQEEGFCPKISGDAIIFKFQGLLLIVNTDSEDERFSQIILPRIYTVTPENKAQALQAANATNSRVKVAKVITLEDHVNVHFEILLDHTPDISDILPRALDILQLARADFYNALG